MIANSVEVSVLSLATQNRLKMIGAISNTTENTTARRSVKGKERMANRLEEVIDEADLETANSREMLQASAKMLDGAPGGGEAVVDDYLWDCLFSGKGNNQISAEAEIQQKLLGSTLEERDDSDDAL